MIWKWASIKIRMLHKYDEKDKVVIQYMFLYMLYISAFWYWCKQICIKLDSFTNLYNVNECWQEKF